jgi:hypothetical protein
VSFKKGLRQELWLVPKENSQSNQPNPMKGCFDEEKGLLARTRIPCSVTMRGLITRVVLEIVGEGKYCRYRGPRAKPLKSPWPENGTSQS